MGINKLKEKMNFLAVLLGASAVFAGEPAQELADFDNLIESYKADIANSEEPQPDGLSFFNNMIGLEDNTTVLIPNWRCKKLHARAKKIFLKPALKGKIKTEKDARVWCAHTPHCKKFFMKNRPAIVQCVKEGKWK